MTIKASNNCVWVVRDTPLTEKGGILIPDSAKKSAHRGEIITVGKLVSDPSIKEGRCAIFNKSSGFDIEEEGVVYTVLSQIDIIGTDETSK